MIVQDVEIFPHTLKDIFSDPEKRQKILKIIIQTLYNLGLQESAAQLEAQSKIVYMTPHIKAIKEALPLEQYSEVEEILLKNKLCLPNLMEILNELKCLKMIREGKTDEALLLIQEKFENPDKKAKLAEQLMMGTGKIPKQQLKKKHAYIIEKCLECDITPHSMAKMINTYIQLEKQGLTQAISPEFSLLKKPTSSKNPPMRMINQYTSSRIKNIVFLKFSRNGDKLIVVSSLKKEKIISLWEVNKAEEEMTEKYYNGMSTDEQIIGVSWQSINGQNQKALAIALQSKLMIFSVPDLRVLHSRKLVMGRHIKILTIQWNPLTGFLYVGGSFQSVKVFSSNMEEIMTIQPFFRTRKLCFNEQGTTMFAVSATKGKLISYSLFEQNQQSSLETPDMITSFKLENNDRNAIVVTESKVMYFGVNYEQPKNMFSVLKIFANPYGENGLVEIEAALFSPWLVFMGQEEFQAISLQREGEKVEKWNSQKSFTFDIKHNLMVSGSKKLILWGSGSYQDAMQEEEESLDDQLEENGLNNNNNNLHGLNLMGMEAQNIDIQLDEDEEQEQEDYEEADEDGEEMDMDMDEEVVSQSSQNQGQ